MLNLQDRSLLRHECLINGMWRPADSGKTIAVLNPATGEQIGIVPDFGRQEAREAIAAAQAALPNWRKRTAKERAICLHAWHDLIMQHQEDLAHIMTAEQGKPLAEARGEVAFGASFIEWFAEEARRVNGDVIAPTSADKRMLVIRQAIGVCGAITPWNFPIAMIARKVGPALASGCTMVVKPAAQTPYSALALGLLAERAGIPAGVLNIITGDAAEIADELTSNPIVRKISFTGSTRIGAQLMAKGAKNIQKLSLELGGNAPFIVFDDADIDAAVEGAMIAKYRNNGQTCVCANRIYVQDGVYDAFIGKFVERVKALRVGNGAKDGVHIGPLIDKRALDKTESLLADAVAKGAHCLIGGERLQPDGLAGYFVSPAVLANVTPTMKVSREEIFGPIAPVIRFTSEEHVIAMANETEYGLASYFYSRDLSRVWRVGEALEFGMVGINTGLISTAEAPFGGVKQSGLGREGSKYGMDDYLEIKYLCMGIA